MADDGRRPGTAPRDFRLRTRDCGLRARRAGLGAGQWEGTCSFRLEAIKENATDSPACDLWLIFESSADEAFPLLPPIGSLAGSKMALVLSRTVLFKLEVGKYQVGFSPIGDRSTLFTHTQSLKH